MSYANDDEWFPYTDDFNQAPESPGAANQFNFEAGNIDNIPLNDDGPMSPGANLEFDLGANLDEYQFGDGLQLSPNGVVNGQQPGPSGEQYQNMHLMQNTDSYDQHMQPSTSVAYNSFEMPTVVNSNLDVGPYQDLGIDDPNSYYANQQPSTSMANDMVMGDSYEMMGGQSNNTYMPQMDQMAGPSSVSNQSQPMQQQDMMQAAPKPKSNKKRPPPKKKPTSNVETVGTALTKATKFSQQLENAGNEGGSEGKVEAKLSAEDSVVVGELLSEVAALTAQQSNGNTDPQVADRLNELQMRIVSLFSKSGGAATAILSTLQISNPATNLQQNGPTAQKKNPPPKRIRNNQPKPVQQQPIQQLQQQPQQKLMMDPPTTTLVPSGSGYNGNSNDNYVMYQPMDQQGTSQQQYIEYQQPGSHEQPMHQPIQAKVVPSMNSRTHTYRQSVVYNPQNPNISGPSPHRMEPVHDPYQEGTSQQMYVPQNQQQQHQQLDDRPMYQPQHQQQHQQHPQQQQQEMEPTLGDVVRQTQGRYQGPQDAPNLRQQLLTNVGASGKQMLQNSAPTPSPGNLHANNNTMHYNEMHQHSYPQSLEPRHSQQGYEPEPEYDNIGEYFGMPNQDQMQMQYQQQQQPGMYQMGEHQMMDPQMEYHQVPEVQPEMTEEELQQQADELRHSRSTRLKKMILDQVKQLQAPTDVTPFQGRLDIFQRMLPYHLYTNGEEPVDNFDAKFQKTMETAAARTKAIGNRVRNIVLRDSMRTATEWEENMLRFMETESERRSLEADRAAAEQNRVQFLRNSDLVQGLATNQIVLEKTRQRVPPPPAHLRELDLQNGELSQLYKEYEFDSNRPKDPPTAFVYQEPEYESEPEEEPFEATKEEDPVPISDLSPLAGFPQISPAVSPDRSRNDSESTSEWKDDEDESPLLSPETEKYTKAADEIRREVFGDDEDLDKAEPFPFAQLARQQSSSGTHPSMGSSVESSSYTESVQSRRSPSPKPIQTIRVQKPRTPSPVAVVIPVMNTPSTSKLARQMSASPELDAEFVSPRLKAEEIAPIALPVPVSQIKKEKEEPMKLPKLSIRVPVSAYQKGMEIAASGDEDVEEIVGPKSREPIKLKFKLGPVKVEEPSPDREFASPRQVPPLTIPARAVEPKITPIKVQAKQETPVFKTPLATPIKTKKPESGERKRRSEKIVVESPEKKKTKPSAKNLLVTPKNGVIEERFLKTMTDGRKITMKIGNIPRNINHFVTPRRDGKGNMLKNLTPTKDTRLRMKFIRRSGQLSVEVSEKNLEEKPEVVNGPSSCSPQKAQTASVSRKGSVDEKKKNNKAFYMMNRFNPFAVKPDTSSAPSTSSTPSVSTPTPKTSSTMPIKKSVPTPTIPYKPKSAVPLPQSVSLATPSAIRRPAPIAAPPINPMPITSTPMIPKIPKIEVNAAPEPKRPEAEKKMSFLPWLDNYESPEGRAKIPTTSNASASISEVPKSSIAGPSTSSGYLTVKTEPTDPDFTVSNAQESPRATSSMSMMMFDDTGPNGFPLFNLNSPKRTNEPLPRVEFSDDEENEIAHSTFSQATDHLLNASSLSTPVNGAQSIFPWTNDP